MCVVCVGLAVDLYRLPSRNLELVAGSDTLALNHFGCCLAVGGLLSEPWVVTEGERDKRRVLEDSCCCCGGIESRRHRC